MQKTCLLCGQYHTHDLTLCEGCQKDLPWIDTLHHCLHCAQPLTAGNSICGKCLQHPPIQKKMLALFDYRFPITPLIQQVKNNRPLLLAELFGKLLAHTVKKVYEKETLPQAIIPIPSHRNRLAQRGHNPPALIGFFTEQKLKIPCLHSACVRIKNTPPQRELNHEQRQQNLRDAFQLKQPDSLKKYSHLVLLDDVVTTGATTQTLAKLLQSHVERIDIWCIARTLREA